MLSNLTDDELLAQATAVRTEAHRAPRAAWSKDHKGCSSITHHTRAWADRSNSLYQFYLELKRRNLIFPSCSCSSEEHTDANY